MDFMVEGNPETILRMVRGYFDSDEWPYREKSKVLGPGLDRSRIACVVDQPPNQWGCAVWLILGIVTFGAAILLWLMWWMFERDSILPQVVVTAYPEGAGLSRVTVVSEKKPEYIEPLAEWIRRELVENRKAAEELPDLSDLPTNDIPDQIRKLDELRKAGIVSNEEFEAKKKELLNRM
jgi:hypothetical protein